MIHFLWKGTIWKVPPKGQVEIYGPQMWVDGHQVFPCKVARACDLCNGKKFNHVSLSEKTAMILDGWKEPVSSISYCTFEAACRIDPLMRVPYKDE